MQLKSMTGRCFLMAALVALPVTSFAASTPVAGDREDTQTLELMKNLGFAANDAAEQAAVLESATFSTDTTWEVHAQKLQALKDDVNEMGRIVSRLQERRNALSAAGRDSLDHVTALLKEMAANSQTAIQFLNADQQNFWLASYKKNVGNLATESAQLANSVGRTIALDKAHGKR